MNPRNRDRHRRSRVELDLNLELGIQELEASYNVSGQADFTRNSVSVSEEMSDEDIVSGGSGRKSPVVELGDDEIEIVDCFSESVRDEISEEDKSVDDCLIGAEKKDAAEFVDGQFDAEGDLNGRCDVETDPIIEEENINNVKVPSPRCEVDVDVDNDDRTEVEGATICKEIEKRLVVGSIVKDLEQAYLLYCEYGRCIGFGVRRGEQRYFGKSNDIKWKEYVCSCAGVPDAKRSTGRVASFKKLVLRTGCKVKIRLSRSIGQPWRVSIFENTHNHGLVPSAQTYLLRSSRNLSYANKAVLEALHSAGIGVSGACGFMERESGGPENLGFTRQDAYDHLRQNKRKTKIANGDATALIEYFINKSNEDPYFYWKVQLDDDHCIMNFFYRDSQCARDYLAFGDLLSVDTTYRTNAYNLICAPFVGINHHTLNVMFGMAFLSDETTSSFEWLFGAFLESMNGVEPKVIFTDQCKAMMNAIDRVFSNSKHRLCQWHINKNAAAQFGPRLNGNAAFKKMWSKCMNEVESEEEFDELWDKMIDGYGLRGNNWFTGMHNIRHRWASVFTRGTFSAGVLATSRSESTNRVLKILHRRNLGLYDFVCNCDEILTRWRRRERDEDTYGIWNPGQFVSDNELFNQAATLYTRNVYNWFESEATKIHNLILSHDTVDLVEGNVEVSVTPHKGGRCRKVIFNKNTHFTTCSCRMWESEGIFCCHILKVYSFMNVFRIPESQILKRWTKKAKIGLPDEARTTGVPSTLPSLLFVNSVMRACYKIASACIENEVARCLLMERVQSAGDEVFAIVGVPEVKTKRKVLSDLNSNDFNAEAIRDPKKILERGFIHARNARNSDGGRRKVLRRKTNKPSTEPMPRVPSQFMEHSTAPPNTNGDESPYWKFRNHPSYHNYSQP